MSTEPLLSMVDTRPMGEDGEKTTILSTPSFGKAFRMSIVIGTYKRVKEFSSIDQLPIVNLTTRSYNTLYHLT